MTDCKSLVVLRGGPHDGLTRKVTSHNETLYVEDDAQYSRTDEQEGDHRVYRFFRADGEPHPVDVREAVDPEETTLARDFRELGDIVKATPANKRVEDQ